MFDLKQLFTNTQRLSLPLDKPFTEWGKDDMEKLGEAYLSSVRIAKDEEGMRALKTIYEGHTDNVPY